MNTCLRLRTAVGAIIVSGAVLASASCSLGPQDVPSIQSNVGNGYEIILHFASIMSLPAGAYVMMDGLRVGEVEGVGASNRDVAVTVGIKAGTRLPADTRAVIRQDTLLGDTYIGLDHDGEENPGYVPPGGSIPLSRTSSPPQLEDTIAVLAYFVNGGSIQKAEDAMSRINTVMPAIDDIRKMSAVMAGDMQDLARHTDEIDGTLAGFDKTAVAMNDKADTLNLVLFNPSAQHYWARIMPNLWAQIGTVLPNIGSVFEGGMWMVPMLNSLADTADAGRSTFDTGPEAVGKISNFLRTVLLPFAQHPSVNIESVESATGDQLLGDTENLLRMLGAVR
ncbi:MlaD family protein [Nocardia sp. AB354]|uniref:MlaD family protein n=1 Tax=Nocardia sp. AB354 TaxID=3413283 RepID=UPI003C1F0A18